MAGHFGREKTLRKLKKSPYFWPKTRETAKKCKSCDVCMKTKSQRKNTRGPCNSHVTMERVAVDILGPLTETENGNKFIIVVADYWTKWTEAYLVRDHTAPTVAKVLVDQCFSKFGLPLILHSDQGREFESKLFQETCELLGVDKTRTSPWRPPCNGMVERFNRTLGAMMRQVMSSHQRD
jgi:hypothetical protein